MNAYQTKPFDTEEIIRLIRKFVGERRQEPVPVEEKKELLLNAEYWPVIEGVESAGVRERIHDDLELFLELLKRFKNENHDLQTPLQLPAKEDEREQLQGRMHKLAGNAGLIGALRLSALARQVEESLRHAGGAGAAELLIQLSQVYVQLARAIDQALATSSGKGEEILPLPLTEGQLHELVEALQLKKITAVKLYRSLVPSLRLQMDEASYNGLEQAMEQLDFSQGQQWLEGLTAKMAGSRKGSG